ncbi:MAG: DUF3794 domain-containing protein [Ruminococcaceae bacterium]|nr:DUF3794 domain-containing protein [Oscillospiraceae bacterium]
MECKIVSGSVLLCETVLDTTAEQPVDAEFTLPDYCPDIGRILKCRALPHITVKECVGEAIRIEGVTRLDVIYQEGCEGCGKNVRCCRYELPFAASIPAAGCGEGAKVSARVRVDYVNCRASSQRRVDIHGAFTLHVKASVSKQYDVISGAEGAGVHTRTQPVAADQFAGRAQSSFTVSEALELAQGKPPISSVIRSEAVINVIECKPIANKLILKGEAVLEVVYCTDTGTRPESMEYVIPFNQFIDLSGVDDSCLLDCAAEAKAVTISLRTDSDGEYRRLQADIAAEADIKAYRRTTLPVVRDAYSTECELELERKYITAEQFAGQQSGRCMAGGLLETPREISEVLDAWCEVTSVSGEAKGGRAAINGNMMVCAIVRLADGDCEYLEKSCPFDSDASLPAGVEEAAECRMEVNARVRNCTCTLSGASKVDMRAETEYSAAVYCGEQLGCVTSIKPDESRKKSGEERPALVIYCADSGEELWSIAREFNTTVECIMEDNDLDGEQLSESRLLLISAK